ncbi:MAG: molybdate ABC transporter substrate-binding protein [Betaproteobacteria bacterium]|nr:MAG: molybdate ABC transporter substrate-binding protein [Betaproteobacteria bacterium]
MRRNRITGRVVVAVALATGLNAANAAELIVSAAASLTNAFSEIGKAFEQTGSGDSAVMNFGGSGKLLQQIDRGAPVDVFASADQQTMDSAQQKGLLADDTRVDFARNSLVLIAPADSTLNITRLDDLRAEKIRRIAVSNPASVPVGAYSRLALQEAGLWQELTSKFINTQHVRQSLDYVARGEVDVGFVYATDARVMADRVKVLLEVPTEIPIRYPIAVVGDTRNSSAARRFLEFVRTPQAQAILRRHGFAGP